jgi:mannose-6-phosphate isomerase-like protein (cupin superfamily)
MYQCLAGGGGKAHLRSFLITLDGKPGKKGLTRHRGEEFILVREGAVRILLGKNVETLYEGDSIYYRSTIPHCIENIEGWHTVILAVICG